MNFRAKIGIKEIQAHYYFGAKIQIFLARFFSRFVFQLFEFSRQN